MGLTLAERRAVTKATAIRYSLASKRGKSRILDELCANTGWHRNHARKAEQSSIPVDRDLLCGLLGSGGVVGPFDEFAVLELRAGADERHEMGRVDRPPA